MYSREKTLSPKKKAPKTEQKPQNSVVMKIGSIKFPVGEAFRFALESIRKRFTRALITAFSVLLGIAFMVTILTMGTILPSVGQIPPAQYQTWMVIIALLVCGVGIVNSMLMSVTERYKEIGTMKCLGATDMNVLQIFLIEALLLGVLGGVLGSCAGWIAHNRNIRNPVLIPRSLSRSQPPPLRHIHRRRHSNSLATQRSCSSLSRSVRCKT